MKKKGLFDHLIDLANEAKIDIEKSTYDSQRTDSLFGYNKPTMKQTSKKKASWEDSRQSIDKGSQNHNRENLYRDGRSEKQARRLQASNQQESLQGQASPLSQEGQHAPNLRDVPSNLENKPNQMEVKMRQPTALSQYQRMQEVKDARESFQDQEDFLARQEQVVKDQILEEIEQEAMSQMNRSDLGLGEDSVIQEILKNLKSEDKLVAAKKAFLYSEIFSRRRRRF